MRAGRGWGAIYVAWAKAPTQYARDRLREPRLRHLIRRKEVRGRAREAARHFARAPEH
jgi:hypothetical protein